jgi:subtilase family serine protease/flagellar hook assembly protein FlgD/fibronectin type 3 domain-containing protein
MNHHSRLRAFAAGLLLALPAAAALSAPAAAPALAQCVEPAAAARKGDPQAQVSEAADHGNITLMTLHGDYSRGLAQPRQAVAQRFLTDHPDRYDFLVVFSTFEFATGDATAFYTPIRNDVAGIGQAQFDHSEAYGSDGRLQGYVDMAALGRYALGTQAPDFEQTRNTLAHELLHRWAAGIAYHDAQGQRSTDLLGRDGTHWSYFLDSDASLLYGADWAVRGDGQFEARSVRYRYSPLDLYLAGFAAAGEVPPMSLIRAGSGNASDLPRLGALSGGSAETVQISQIIAAEGVRVPAAAAAQKDFRAGLILLRREGETVSPAILVALEALRVRAQQHFAQVTDGRGVLRIFNEARDSATAQLPPILASETGGSQPAGVAAAVAWLKTRQQPAGHWQDRPATALRDTAAVLQLLQAVEPGYPGIATARDWLAARSVASRDQLAWRLLASGNNADKDTLLQNQSSTGGWGLAAGLQDGVLDTAVVAAALAGQDAGGNGLRLALQQLAAQQNPDGGFGIVAQGRGRLLPTLRAARAFQSSAEPAHAAIRDTATQWLVNREIAAGGSWSDDAQSSYSDTIELYSLVGSLPFPTAVAERARQSVRGSQNGWGDWQGSVYLTATAALAWARDQRVNFAVTATPQATPAAPVDGDIVRLSALVTNNGHAPAGASIARWYLGDPAQGGTLIGADLAVPALPPGEQATLAQTWFSRDLAGSHTLWLVLDATDTADELDEADNRIALPLQVAAAPAQADLLLDAGLLALDPSSIDSLPRTVTLSGLVRNLGNTPVAAARLRLGTPLQVLAETTVAVPARGETALSLSFETSSAQTLRLRLQADPENTVAEAREDNNQAELLLPYGQTFDLALDGDALSLVPGSTPSVGRDVEFLLRIRNRGTRDAVQVPLLAEVVQGATTSLITPLNDSVSVAAGQVAERRLRWRAGAAGAAQLRAQVDAADLFAEINEANNSATLDFSVAEDSLPDLAALPASLQFLPDPALQGQPLQARLRVRNQTGVAAGAFRVVLYAADPAQGGRQLAAAHLTGLAGGAETEVTLDVAALDLRGDTALHAVVDAAAQVQESDEGNNVALRTLSVLPLADLALSPAAITLSPSQPAAGAPLRLRARLRNTGAQDAGTFSVRLYEGSPETGSPVPSDQAVPGLAPGAEIELEWNWTFAASGAPQQLSVVADVANAVAENEKRNNTAVVPIAVQQRGFYASERFISPDGDGVRDEAALYFLRPGPGALQVEIRSAAGRVQRLFEQVDNTNQGGGQLSWDGRDARGRVVADGEYTALLLRDGREAARLGIVVDLNRSSFLAAAGTRHQRGIALPAADAWQHAPATPATRGYAYAVTVPPDISGAPTPGIYRASVLSGALEPIVSGEWLRGWLASQPGGVYDDFAFSPDGRWIVFRIRRGSSIALAVAASDLRDRVRVLVDDLYPTADDLLRLPLTFIDARNVIAGTRDARWAVDLESGQRTAERALPDGAHNARLYSHGSYAWTSGGQLPSHYVPRNPAAAVVALPHDYEGVARFNADGSALALRYIVDNHLRAQLFQADSGNLATLQEVDYDPAAPPGGPALNLQWLAYPGDLLLLDGVAREARFYTPRGQLRLRALLPARDDSLLDPPDAFIGAVQTVGSLPGGDREGWEFAPGLQQWYDPARRRAVVVLDSDYLGKGTCEDAVNLCDRRETALREYFAVDLDNGSSERLGYTNQDVFYDTQPLPKLSLAGGDALAFDGYYALAGQDTAPEPWPGHSAIADAWFGNPPVSSDDSSVLFTRDGQQQLESTLGNLATALWAAGNERSIELSGIAADRDFEQWQLDWASTSTPDDWHSLLPPSGEPVLHDDFLAWVPPEPGSYLIRLSTQDKAGNRATAYASAYSAQGSPIDELALPQRYLSPNGDGVKDSITASYRVRHASSFVAQVLDASGAVVRSETLVYASGDVGTHEYSWDGRDQAGQIVPDGRYALGLAGLRLPLYVDTQAPQLRVELQQPLTRYTLLDGREATGVQLRARLKAGDANLERGWLESAPRETDSWRDIGATAGENALVGAKLRGRARDMAGNEITLAAPDIVDQLLILPCIDNCPADRDPPGAQNERQPYQGAPHPLPADQAPSTPLSYLRGVPPRIWIHRLAPDVQQIELQARINDTAWQAVATVPVSAALRTRGDNLGEYEFPQIADYAVTDRVLLRAVGLRADASRTLANQVRAQISLLPPLYAFCYGKAATADHPAAVHALLALAPRRPGELVVVAPSLRTGEQAPISLRRQLPGADPVTVTPLAANGHGAAFIVPALPQQQATVTYTLPGGAQLPAPGISTNCADETVISRWNAEANPLVDLSCGSSPTGKIEFSLHGPQVEHLQLFTLQGSETAMLFDEQPPPNERELFSLDPLPEWGRRLSWDHRNRPAGTAQVTARLSAAGNSTDKSFDLPLLRAAPAFSLDRPAAGERVCAAPDVAGESHIALQASRRSASGMVFDSVLHSESETPPACFPGGETGAGCTGTRQIALEPVNQQGLLRDVATTIHGPARLYVRAADWSGASVCAVRQFVIDRKVDWQAVSVQPAMGRREFVNPTQAPEGLNDTHDLIGHSRTGLPQFRTIDITLLARETLHYRAELYHSERLSEEQWTVGQPIARIAEADAGPGEFSLHWNGEVQGVPLQDGDYVLRLFAEDSCGFGASLDYALVVDNTPPTLTFTAPAPGAVLDSAIISARGSVQDINLGTLGELGAWQLFVRRGGDNGQLLNQGDATVPEDSLLGHWNRGAITGGVEFLLDASDDFGNRSQAGVNFSLPSPSLLLGGAALRPELFSPNGDGRLDLARLDIFLLAPSLLDVHIVDMSNNTVAVLAAGQLAAAGTRTLEWNGLDMGGSRAADGRYRVLIQAQDPALPTAQETAVLELVVDSTTPEITDVSPAGDLAGAQGRVAFRVRDPHIDRYDARLLAHDGTEVARLGGNSAALQTLALTDALAEGSYRLEITAQDRAGNRREFSHAFTVDKTAPELALLTPANGAVVARNGTPLLLRGSVADARLAGYHVEISPAAQDSWTEIGAGSGPVNAGELGVWNVQQPDGDYRLRLRASDQAGNEAAVIHAIRIDGTPPQAQISAPAEGALLHREVQVSGTATDANLQEYTITHATPAAAAAGQWTTLLRADTPVQDGLLAALQLALPEGEQRLRLRVTDKAGFSAEASVSLRIDNQPPPAPLQLQARLQDGTAVLDWNAVAAADLAGYAVYRNGLRINPALQPDAHYADAGLDDGRWRYEVTALDQAGNESAHSNAVELLLDRSAPLVQILAPAAGERVRGLVAVSGTAYSVDDFDSYTLSVRRADGSDTPQIVAQSSRPAQNQLLAQWNSAALAQETSLVLRLSARDRSGNEAAQEITILVDNEAPAAPTGLAAVLGGEDSLVSWNAGSEADLLGYLLYRDGRLLNAPAQTGADLRPYALQQVSYTDAQIGDGTHSYVLFAIDQAGNLSPPSAPATLGPLESGPPELIIDAPADDTAFEQSIAVRASSPDRDIARVTFAWRVAGGGSWTDFAELTQTPYRATWTPTGLPYGDYEIRALARDTSDLDDPEPPLVRVRLADLTAPDAPATFSALADGGDVQLAWSASASSDVAGYRVERWNGGWQAVAPDTTATSLVDSGLTDFGWQYRVQAVDQAGNLSSPVTAQAQVFTPQLQQPFTPTSAAATPLQGSSPRSGTLAVQVTHGAGSSTLPGGQTDADGNFSIANLPLQAGDNEISVRVTDAAGNRSRAATLWITRGNPPVAPTGLTATVDAYDAELDWQTNSEPGVIGYRLERDGQAAPDVAAAAASATSNICCDAYAAGDGNPATAWTLFAWLGAAVNNPSDAPSLHLYLPAPQVLTGLRLEWLDAQRATGNLDVYARSSHGAWLRIAQVRAAAVASHGFSFDQPYRTDALRLVLYSPQAQDVAMELALAEVQPRALDLVPAPPVQQTVTDGRHEWRVAAVNALGMQGAWSASAIAAVGDATPPDAVTLQGSLSGNTASLSWSASSAADIARYQLRRNGLAIASIPAAQERSYSDANLALGTHSYDVIAVDAFGNASAASNTVTLLVEGSGPGRPQDLRVTPEPAGAALRLAWNDGPGSTAVAWQLRRALAAGGPFVDIAQTSTNTPVDSGLANGTRYWYTVEAIDAAGNRSGPSEPASGVPFDGQTPAAPLLTYPSDLTHALDAAYGRTLVCGQAEVGSSVGILRNGVLTATLQAAGSYTRRDLAAGVHVQQRPAPDGVHMAGLYDGTLRITDLRDQSLRSADVTAPRLLHWAAHGLTLYLASEQQILAWPAGSAAPQPLLEAAELRSFAVSADEQRLLLVGSFDDGIGTPEAGLWLLDRDGGNAHRSTAVAAEEIADGEPQLSHDGRYALLPGINAGWLLLDLSLDSRLADLDAWSGVTPRWAPDSRHLVYAQPDGAFLNWRVQRYDSSSAQAITLYTSTQQIHALAWSPDGGSIAVWKDDGLQIIDAASGAAQPDARFELYGDWDSLRWTASGTISTTDDAVAQLITPPGWFCSGDIVLQSGPNRFSAQATDTAGNRSLAAPPVLLTLAAAGLPDLALSAADIFFSPATAQPGQSVSALFTLRNRGGSTVEAPLVQASLRLPDGREVAVPVPPQAALDAGAARSISLDLGTVADLGTHRLRLHADAAGALAESEENNNLAEAEFGVLANAQPQLEVNLDSAVYAPGEAVRGEIRVLNPGASFSGRLRARIVDAQGALVASLGDSTISELSYAQRWLQAVDWNAAGVFAGDYRLHAQLLRSDGSLLAEQQAVFAIQALRHIQLDVAAESSPAAAGSSIALSSSLRFGEGNALLAGASLRVSVQAPSGAEVWSASHALGVLAPGYELRKQDMWNSAGAEPGVYTLRLALTAPDFEASSESSLTLAGAAGPQLQGTLALAPAAQAIAGQSSWLDYRVTADSAQSALELRLRVFRAPGQPALFERNETIPLSANVEHIDRLDLDMAGLQLSPHLSVLDARLPGDAPGQWRLLARQGFAVIDAQAPQISVLTPAASQWVTAPAPLRARIEDAHSRVALAEVRVDGGPWQPLSAGSDGSYARGLDGLADGAHSLVLRARDTWGNERISAALPFQLDSSAPLIDISGISEGQLSNQPLSALVSISDTNLDATQTRILLDGADYTPGSAISAEGEHVLAVRAQDLAGNLAQASLRFRIDTTAPAAQILQPADGAVVENSSVAVLVQSEAQARVSLMAGSYNAEVTAGTDGLASFSAVPLVEGDNDIEMQAHDAAGNSSAAAMVSVRYEIAVPQPLVGTLQAVAELAHGETLDVSVRLRNPGSVALGEQTLRLMLRSAANATLAQRDYVRSFAGGEEFLDAPSFSSAAWPLGLASLRLEILRNGDWTVLDEGSVDVVDRTPPQLQALAPQDGQVLAAPLRVRATASDALSPPVTAEYRLGSGPWQPLSETATPGTFESAALKLADGDYSLSLRARDSAGNLAQTSAQAFAVDSTAPVITISGVADGDLLNHAVTPQISVADAHPAALRITLNGQPFSSGTAISSGGDYTLRAEADDEAGNSAAEEISFTLDFVAPVVSVSTPVHGSTVTVAEQVISGSTEALASVQIDAPGLVTTLKAGADGQFSSVPATLQPGLNTLRLRATDRAGNLGPERVVEVTYQPSQAQSGSVQFLATPLTARRGQPLAVNYRLRNTGSTAWSAVPVRTELLPTAGSGALGQDDWNATLAAQTETDHLSTFATSAILPGDYRAVVSAWLRDAGGTAQWVELASAAVTIRLACVPPHDDESLFAGRFERGEDVIFCDSFDPPPPKHAAVPRKATPAVAQQPRRSGGQS